MTTKDHIIPELHLIQLNFDGSGLPGHSAYQVQLMLLPRFLFKLLKGLHQSFYILARMHGSDVHKVRLAIADLLLKRLSLFIGQRLISLIRAIISHRDIGGINAIALRNILL